LEEKKQNGSMNPASQKDPIYFCQKQNNSSVVIFTHNFLKKYHITAMENNSNNFHSLYGSIFLLHTQEM